MEAVLQATPDTAFDLDLSIVDGGDVVAALWSSTDDGCGSTCPSACASRGGRI